MNSFFQFVHFRDPQIFPHPDSHHPERWLREEDAAAVADQQVNTLVIALILLNMIDQQVNTVVIGST